MHELVEEDLLNFDDFSIFFVQFSRSQVLSIVWHVVITAFNLLNDFMFAHIISRISRLQFPFTYFIILAFFFIFLSSHFSCSFRLHVLLFHFPRSHGEL